MPYRPPREDVLILGLFAVYLVLHFAAMVAATVEALQH